MKRNTMIALGTVALVFSLGACSTGPIDAAAGTEVWGNAVRQNIAVQAVNPEPIAQPAAPDFDGHRAELSIRRYQTDKVKKPKGLGTSGTSFSSAGGGGE